MDAIKLNLGCNDRLLRGYINVDRVPPADQLVDLSQPWPWSDNAVAEILAQDIIEHLPDKILTMNEAWRILEPGGVFDIDVPTTDGRGAFQDPTHTSWWNRNSFFYFTDGIAERERFGKAYGVRARFEVLSEKTTSYPDGVVKLRIKLKAVK
jgi:SAM-dependent methyltransferase